MAPDQENGDGYRFRDCYGTFLVTTCPICGETVVQPLYKDESLDIKICQHSPSVKHIPRELILQRIPPSESRPGFPLFNLRLRRK